MTRRMHLKGSISSVGSFALQPKHERYLEVHAKGARENSTTLKGKYLITVSKDSNAEFIPNGKKTTSSSILCVG